MKYFNWNEDKNRKLRKSRNISFEQIVLATDDGKLLDVLQHQNKGRYLDQFVLIVDIRNYAYVVPFVEDGESYFVETIYPSRKATKTYLNAGE
jgi:uncharacterized DUF497 family protein